MSNVNFELALQYIGTLIMIDLTKYAIVLQDRPNLYKYRSSSAMMLKSELKNKMKK